MKTNNFAALPDIKLVTYRTKIILSFSEKYKNILEKKLKEMPFSNILLTTYMFPQMWGTGATAFDDKYVFSTQAIAPSYVTVVHEELCDVFCVYIGNKYAYTVFQKNNNFLNDMNKREIGTIQTAKKRYNAEIIDCGDF